MRKLIYAMAALTLLLVQCHQKPGELAADEILIQGKYLNSANTELVLESISPNGYFAIDTVRSDPEGKFEFRFNTTGIGIYRVRNSLNSFLTIIASPGEILQIEADALDVNGSYSVKGSVESELIYSSELAKRSAYKQLGLLQQKWEAGKDSGDHLALRMSLDSAAEVIYNDYRSSLESFIDSNNTRLASIFALYQRLAGRKMFDEMEDLQWFDKVAAGLSKSFPDNPHTLDLQKKIDAIRASMASGTVNEGSDSVTAK